MPPETYRCYRLDRAGHIDNAEWLSAASDEEAKAQIEAKHPDGTCEIWNGSRMVARVWPKGMDPDESDVQNAVGGRLSALARRIRLGLEPGL